MEQVVPIGIRRLPGGVQLRDVTVARAEEGNGRHLRRLVGGRLERPFGELRRRAAPVDLVIDEEADTPGIVRFPAMRGKRGSVACALGAAMPSIIIILAIALFVGNYKDNPVVENVFKGIRPAVIALILTPTIRLASKAGLNKWNWWVPVATALLIWWIGVSPVWIILAAIVGAILYYILKLRKA